MASVGEARRIVDLYRLRWIAEEFFRTLKTAGFDVEAADIVQRHPLVLLGGELLVQRSIAPRIAPPPAAGFLLRNVKVTAQIEKLAARIEC